MDTITGKEFESFIGLIQKLRSPQGGCPWDRKQTLSSMRQYLLEECYETISAIDMNDSSNIQEELGDILLIITMMCVIGEEKDSFSMESVISGIKEKIIRRHPHVFGNLIIDKAEDVVKKWDEIKVEEKSGQENGRQYKSTVDIKSSYSEIERAYRIQKAASKMYFDWNTQDDVLDKINEELFEFRQAVMSGKDQDIEEELGDILFSVINLSRKMHVHPSVALHRTNEKFIRRFYYVEKCMQKDGITMSRDALETMEKYWQESKKILTNE